MRNRNKEIEKSHGIMILAKRQTKLCCGWIISVRVNEDIARKDSGLPIKE